MVPPAADALAAPPLAPVEGRVFAWRRIVALGGGTGLPVVLRGLSASLATAGGDGRAAPDRERLTAIVTVADDGGSSGRLRRAYGIRPPGDVRNCLLALSEHPGTLASLFGYRFDGDGEVAGHSLGNLILAALSRIESGFERAVQAAGDILGVSGRVLPATAEAVALEAEFEDGTRIRGESRIAAQRRRIRRIRLRPEAAPALPQALEAIAGADCIVLGPGSLYTSLIPVLLVQGLADAIGASHARVVLVMNLMTEPGETDGHSAPDHLLALRAHAPDLPVHDVIVNATPLTERVRRRYALQGAYPLSIEREALEAFGCRVRVADLLAAGPKVRHDAPRLGRAILDLASEPAIVNP
ncbi:MAG TPA: uridine diphosphate-N-acetylglucosamine-binding protein YvcK [Vicinamibacteria bacterium]|jgi:uncharacterized cofD-like protein